jgi:hypothetical protein
MKVEEAAGNNLLAQIKAQSDHRKQVLWQIIAPLGGAVLIFLLLAILVVISGPGYAPANQWASVSLITLILPCLVVGLVLLVMVSLLAFAAFWLTQKLPGFSAQVRGYLFLAVGYIHQAADIAVRPVLIINTWLAGIEKFLNFFKGKSDPTARNEEK